MSIGAVLVVVGIVCVILGPIAEVVEPVWGWIGVCFIGIGVLVGASVTLFRNQNQ